MNSTTTAPPDPLTTTRSQKAALSLFTRESLLCVVIFCICLLIVWPVAEVGVNDDWVYTITAFDFARTGHFIFHGWASPMLGWQAMWGALFSKLFGHTYTAVRLSTIPVAAFCVLLYHAILRRFGLNAAHATFGTLVFALSPVFLPLSTSFMTDVPAILPILLCLYLCQLAVVARTDTKAVLWLTAAALSNIALGTVRQIAWLGVLVMVPGCVWLLRRRRNIVPAGIALWLTGAVSIHFLMGWFNRQPFTAPEKLIPGKVGTYLIPLVLHQISRGTMTILLLVLPVLTIALSSLPWRQRATKIRAGSLLVILAVALLLLRRAGQAHVLFDPWLGNTVGHRGIMQDGLFGSNPVVPNRWQVLLFVILVASAFASFEVILAYRRRSVPTAQSEGQIISWKSISLLLLPFVICYCGMLLPRAAFFVLFDRYLLEIIALLLIYALRWHQVHVSARIPLLSAAFLVAVASLTVADTHDLFATYRAEVRLANELQAAGIPRTQIRGGFAYDFATQVYAQGYVNDERVLNPPGAYHFIPDTKPWKLGGVYCDYPIQKYLPALHIRYVLSPEPTPCLAPSQFPAQKFRAWLPPLKRQIYAGIQLPQPGTPNP
ncbi:MAG TPA: hypothetical protein VFA99_17080 [Acidobacteriaceae bacterium]|nr:hypothetical protein [Acidobacteriaceae bacterium]